MAEKLSVEAFYEAGMRGKLLGLRCKAGHVTVPPRRSCRACESVELEVIELSGRATVISSTDVYSKAKEFPLEVPYTLALASLDEGGNLLGVLEPSSRSSIAIGSRVTTKFRAIAAPDARLAAEKGRPRIFFELA